MVVCLHWTSDIIIPIESVNHTESKNDHDVQI